MKIYVIPAILSVNHAKRYLVNVIHAYKMLTQRDILANVWKDINFLIKNVSNAVQIVKNVMLIIVTNAIQGISY